MVGGIQGCSQRHRMVAVRSTARRGTLRHLGCTYGKSRGSAVDGLNDLISKRDFQNVTKGGEADEE